MKLSASFCCGASHIEMLRGVIWQLLTSRISLRTHDFSSMVSSGGRIVPLHARDTRHMLFLSCSQTKEFEGADIIRTRDPEVLKVSTRVL